MSKDNGLPFWLRSEVRPSCAKDIGGWGPVFSLSPDVAYEDSLNLPCSFSPVFEQRQLARSLSLRFTLGVQRLDMPGDSANQKPEEIAALSNLQLSSEDRKSDLAFLEEHPSVWYFEMSCSLHLEMGYLQKATFPLQTANIDVHSFEPLKPNITGDIAQ